MRVVENCCVVQFIIRGNWIVITRIVQMCIGVIHIIIRIRIGMCINFVVDVEFVFIAMFVFAWPASTDDRNVIVVGHIGVVTNRW